MRDPRYLSRAAKIREGAGLLDPADFNLALTVHAAVTEERADLFVKGFAQTFLNEIHSGGQYSPGTPVDTGFARANWHAGLGDAGPAPVVESGIGRASGELAGEAQAALEQLDAVALEAKAGDVLVVQNNAHYIGDLENGTSLQAPEGMVRLAVMAGQLIADEVAGHVMGPRVG